MWMKNISFFFQLFAFHYMLLFSLLFVSEWFPNTLHYTY